MPRTLDKAIRERALMLRHYAAIDAVTDTPDGPENVHARYELLLAVVAPSDELAELYEQAARDELTHRPSRFVDESIGAVA